MEATDAEKTAAAMGAVAAFLRHHQLPVGAITVQTNRWGTTAYVTPDPSGSDRAIALAALETWRRALGSDVTTSTYQGREHHTTSSQIGSHRVEVTVITAPADVAVPA